jgi:hypothetical protein
MQAMLLRANVGLTGADGLQGMGLARTLLMRRADHAASSGIGRMRSDTIAANTAIILLATCTGFAVARKPEGRLARAPPQGLKYTAA